MKINLEFDTKDGAVSFLQKLDRAVWQENNFSDDLWGLLTAMRGPDISGIESLKIKQRFTCPIRNRVLPGIARAAGALRNDDCIPIEVLRQECVDHFSDDTLRHFHTHTEWALQILFESELNQNHGT